MKEKKEKQSTITISKSPAYQKHRVLINLDPERDTKFNKGDEVEITQEELNLIGHHRWLEVKRG